MTRQEFESRYQLLRPLEGEAYRTHLARSRSGAIVMVHFLDAKPAEWADGRLAHVETLDHARREKIIDVVEDDRDSAVVTRFLMDFHSFAHWMGVPGSTAPEAPSGESSREVSEPGPGIPLPGAVQPSSVGGPTAGAAEPPPTLGAFRALDPASSKAGEPAASASTGDQGVPSDGQIARDGGDLFGNMAGAENAPPAAGPGEFTQAFLAPVSPAPGLSPEAVAGHAEPEPPPQEEALPDRVPVDAAPSEPQWDPSRTAQPEAVEPPADIILPSEVESEGGAEMGEFTRAFRASSLTGEPPDFTNADPGSFPFEENPRGEAPPPEESPLDTGGAAGPTELAAPSMEMDVTARPSDPAPAEWDTDGSSTPMELSAPNLDTDSAATPTELTPPRFETEGQPEMAGAEPDSSANHPGISTPPPLLAGEVASGGPAPAAPPPDSSEASYAPTEIQDRSETPVPNSTESAGEFTRMFQAKRLADLEGEPSTFPEPGQGGMDDAPAPTPSSAGEFTRTFQAQRAADLEGEASPVPPAEQPEAEDAPAPPPTTAGEFTRMFQAQHAAEDALANAPTEPNVRPPQIAEPAAPPEAGEFTRAFRGLSDPGRESVPAAPSSGPSSPLAPVSGEPSFEPSSEAPSSGPAPSEPPAATAPGEFTQMFRAQADSARDAAPTTPADGIAATPSRTPTAGPPTPPVPPTPPAAAPPRPAAPPEGEFTKMFRAASSPAAASPPAATPPPYVPEPPPPPAAAGQPGEFTRAMRSLDDPRDPPRATPPSPPAPPAAPPPASAKGEFTTMFEKLAGAPPPPPQAPPAQPSYGSGPTSSPMWPSDPGPADDRYRDRLFNAPPPPARAPQQPPPAGPRHGEVIPVDPELPPLPAQMAPPPPPPAQVGGEYTRMISAFAPPPTPAAPASAAPLPGGSPPPGGALAKKAATMAEKQVTSRLPTTGLLFGFGAIGFSALALILYLVMKSVMMPSPAETEAPTDTAAAAAPAGELPPP